MTTITNPTTMLSGRSSAGIVEHITAAVRARLVKMRARHECRTLLECQDHMLRDIGVSRADIEAELFNSYR